MNYVEHLNLFGVEAKEIPCVRGSGVPTESTIGAVGLLYMDVDTGDIYKCTADSDGVYEWHGVGNSVGSVESAVLYTEQELTDAQKEQARANIGAAAIVQLTDEDLLSEGYVLDPDKDLLHGIYTSTGAFASMEGINGAHCTRKIVTTRIPKITGLTPLTYIFFSDGYAVAEIIFTELSKTYEVNFHFDTVVINFAYGWTERYDSQCYIYLDIPTKYKKPLIIGDSISADYYGNYNKWVTQLIDEKFFPLVTVNDSIHATGFVARYNNETNDFISRIEAIADKNTYDLVVIFGGINDYIQAIPMGENNGDKTAQFVPAVDYFFEYLVDNFSQARIVVLSPLLTYNSLNNAAGHNQTEYSDYIREVAKSYCLPVLNLTEESGFYPFNETFKNLWTLIPEGYDDADGVHPNAEYQSKFLAPMIKNFLQRFV